jgi:CheY-like chemotaxis protein
MKPTCRLLLIEDDSAEAQTIERSCCPDPDNAAIDVVTDVKAAEDALAKHEYDLVICDLALPADERKFDPEVSEGLRLFQLIRERAAGTPVIILSGNLNLQILQGFLKDSRSDDIYGRRTEEPLVQAFAKEELPNCIDAVQAHIARIKTLDTLELDGDAALSVSDARSIEV